MGEWLKPAVLKTDPARSCKFLKTKQILKPANNLRLFSVSPDFTHFQRFLPRRGDVLVTVSLIEGLAECTVTVDRYFLAH